MRWIIVGAFSILLVLTQTSCGQANFSGKGGGNSSQPPVSSNPNGTTPGQTIPGNGTTNNPGAIPGGPGGSNPNFPTNPNYPYGPGIPGAPGYNPMPGTPNQQCPNTPCQATTIPEYGPVTEIETTNNSIVFGKNHPLHIGNGRFEGDSCLAQTSAIPLSGAVYFFMFEVTQDNTVVDVNITGLCGVQYTGGMLQLALGTSNLSQQPLPAGATGLPLAGKTLNRGVYTVYIYPGIGNGSNGPTWDKDDFVVDKVRVTGSLPIKAGAFGAYQ